MKKSYLPNGPAARTTHNGFNGCSVNAMALIQNGIVLRTTESCGFSGKPHGSANMRCLTLLITNLRYKKKYGDSFFPCLTLFFLLKSVKNN